MLTLGPLAVALAAVAVTAACAADCVDTKRNNAAFSSTYVEAVKPCPPPLAPLAKPPTAKPDATPRVYPSADSAKKPVDSPDKPIVTSNPGGGTLIKYGATTVCVSGSVTVRPCCRTSTTCRHATERARRRPHDMTMFIIAGLVLLYLAFVGGFLRFDREQLVEQVTRMAGGALMIVAIFLALIGRELAGAATALVGLTIMGAATDVVSNVGYNLGRRMRGVLRSVGLGALAGATRSTVRATLIEVIVDTRTGVVGGRVLGGTFQGRMLGQMSIVDLAILRREVSADRDSRLLLDAYLDRRQPGWREDLKFDRDAGEGRAARAGNMTEKEAHEVLGLQPGAGQAEIREAHRRLIKAVHPDVGGSAFLAAKINEAKDRLIGKHI
jgi:hypothetical protein